jgi:hypothetical protein
VWSDGNVCANFCNAPTAISPCCKLFDCCTNLIRTLPTLTFDKNDHEDVSDRCEDHAAEALRYGLMSRAKTRPRKIITAEDRRKAYDPFKPVEPRHSNDNRFLRA